MHVVPLVSTQAACLSIRRKVKRALREMEAYPPSLARDCLQERLEGVVRVLDEEGAASVGPGEN